MLQILSFYNNLIKGYKSQFRVYFYPNWVLGKIYILYSTSDNSKGTLNTKITEKVFVNYWNSQFWMRTGLDFRTWTSFYRTYTWKWTVLSMDGSLNFRQQMLRKTGSKTLLFFSFVTLIITVFGVFHSMILFVL